jgi:FkbM family methyltransferase
MTSRDTWTVAVERRTFAEIVSLPFWAAKLVGDPTRKPEGMARFVRKLSRSMCALLYRRLGLSGPGVMRVGQDRVAVPINGGHSVYVDFAGRSRFGGYEPVETAMLDRLLPRAGVFYDVGSNWGYYTLLARTNTRFSGDVFAFDVLGSMSDELENIVSAAGFDRVHVMRFGLSDVNGEISVSREHHAHLTRVLDGEGAEGLCAVVRRLDDLDLPPPDLIKIDVEDHELSVLRGGERLIETRHPAILLESRAAQDDARRKPLAFLSDKGYALLTMEFGNSAETEIALRRIDLARESWSSTDAMNILALPDNEVERWLA